MTNDRPDDRSDDRPDNRSVASTDENVREALFEDEICDGIHDDGAPLMYLCTRCFPKQLGGDLLGVDDEDADERRDDDQEMG